MRKNGFTLAEVLITLGIIGVVAALTMPSLIADYKKKVYVAQLQKAVSSLSQGFSMMKTTEGIDLLEDSEFVQSMREGDGYGEAVETVLKKYFHVVRTDSGRRWQRFTKYSSLSGKKIDTSDDESNWTVIYLADGSRVSFYEYWHRPNDYPRYLYFYIDVNGDKKPNQLGRDTFEYILSDEGVLYPYGSETSAVEFGLGYYWRDYSGCETSRPSSGESCAARIMENGWVMDY
jgi:prepilin-type N-terminal cleavage/methylation domain-containing protein